MIEYKDIEGLEFKEEGDGEGEGIMRVWGYAATYEDADNPDAWGEIISPKAVKKSPKEMPLLAYHNQPAGLWTKIENDPDGTLHGKRGLWVEGHLLDVPVARELKTLVKGRVIKGLSIGFFVKKFSYVETKKGTVRQLDEIEVMETSLTPFPANRNAKLVGAKQIDHSSLLEELKEMVATLKKEVW